MIKAFKIIDDCLHVIVNNEDTVFIPNGSEKEDVGIYRQETVQIIKKDKINVLYNFVKSEKETSEKKLKELSDRYEPIKDIEEIGEDIKKHCQLAIKKGSKTFKETMKPLNQRIIDLANKDNMKAQIDYMTKQMEEVNSDYDSLTEIVNDLK